MPVSAPYGGVLRLRRTMVRITLAAGIFGIALSALPAGGVAVFDIERLPLLPGSYHLAVEVGDQGERIDFLPRALDFEVLWRDVFGTGRLQDNIRGSMIIKARARIID